MNKFGANNATNNDIIKNLFCALLTNYFLTKWELNGSTVVCAVPLRRHMVS